MWWACEVLKAYSIRRMKGQILPRCAKDESHSMWCEREMHMKRCLSLFIILTLYMYSFEVLKLQCNFPFWKMSYLKVLLLFNSYHLNWEFIGQVKPRIWHKFKVWRLFTSGSHLNQLAHVMGWDCGIGQNWHIAVKEQLQVEVQVCKSVSAGICEISASQVAPSLECGRCDAPVTSLTLPLEALI